MSEKQEKSSQKATSGSTDDVQAANVKQAFDEANDQGYFGYAPDPTPNENYTVKGVTSGAPTPETDEGLREEARKARRQ